MKLFKSFFNRFQGFNLFSIYQMNNDHWDYSDWGWGIEFFTLDGNDFGFEPDWSIFCLQYDTCDGPYLEILGIPLL